ncbi:MAG: transcription termination/antitermination NusG family protein, partial [Roseiflexaceae bacterium]
IETFLDINVYLPQVHQRVRGKSQATAFFPGYLFVRADFQIVAPSKLNSMPGVVRLLTFDDQPRSLPTAMIDHIRQQVQDIDAQGSRSTHHFQPGDTVRLKAGPFRGLEAAFLGPMKPTERVRVLIEFLGSMREADVGVDDLERVQSAPLPARQERRIRGKGRPIARRAPLGT